MKTSKSKTLSPAWIALGAAFLFGLSTPAAKVLIGQMHAQLLAGLLYLGSGVGLFFLNLDFARLRLARPESRLRSPDWLWLAGAVACGGIAGPLLLMLGLMSVSGATASLLLNIESIFTALLAWFAFKENFDRRIVLGMVSIILGSILLVWQPENAVSVSVSIGPFLIVGACLCWAIDNNLTRNISHADPTRIAAIKGLTAGIINCGIALAFGSHLPEIPIIATTMLIGFLGYGFSLVLFIKALRYLGTARTGAYFATAPFAGVVLSVILLREPLTVNLIIATGFMAFGVWLHLTEVHSHVHSHLEEEHEHLHWHDEHHQHEHDPDVLLEEPHSHLHKHGAITHWHPHYPDTHHRHHH
jgi:drug/metabolite transporter (DMT)-like permease